jgi:hypothetical protein
MPQRIKTDLYVVRKDHEGSDMLEAAARQLEQLVLTAIEPVARCHAVEIIDLKRYRLISKPAKVLKYLRHCDGDKPFVFCSSKN